MKLNCLFFYMLTSEDVDEVIYHFFHTCLSKQSDDKVYYLTVHICKISFLLLQDIIHTLAPLLCSMHNLYSLRNKKMNIVW